jgi:hypothetical protein
MPAEADKINGRRKYFLIKKVTKILGIARLVPEAKSYLVRSARPTSGPILKVLKERAEELRNFHVETYMPGGC